jgi:hypothetical protein
MLTEYIHEAMSKAVYEKLEDGTDDLPVIEEINLNEMMPKAERVAAQ